MRSSGVVRQLTLPIVGLVGALLLVACTSTAEPADERGTTDSSGTSDETSDPATPRFRFRYPEAPSAPTVDAANDPAVRSAIDAIGNFLPTGSLEIDSVRTIGESGDARHGWYLADLLGFFRGAEADELVAAFEQLSGVSIADDPDAERSLWLSVSNHLIAWDTPAYPGYQDDKGALFTRIESGWEPFFADADADIDWRQLTWGGVLIDDRPLGATNRCPGGCIPSLDDPATTDASGGDWYPDDRIVFGLVEGGEALAIPKNIAEIHEMFNLTLGDRRIGLPYCTLCGSAQAYFLDNTSADEQPVLRTSGLLIRSNKVMYDLVTSSVFDTFTGAAVSGPLRAAGVVLEQTTLVLSTWGAWKQANPETRIIAQDGGLSRSYSLDPLGGRDDDGPIFPIGNADARLDVQELVVGVIADDGTPIAFPSAQASGIIASGGEVVFGGVRLEAVGDGLRAVDATTGTEIAAHEAFWFAWSQFHPDTELYLP